MRMVRATETGYELYDRAGYFRQLAREVAATKKGSRVAVMTMPVNPREPLVRALFDELCAAAKRGVRVLVSVDAYTFLNAIRHELKIGPLWFHGGRELTGHRASSAAMNATNTTDAVAASLGKLRLARPFRDIYDQLEAVRLAGGAYRITNVPDHRFSLPPAGRSHIKLAVVDNIIKLGGCNLEDAKDLDIMASSNHPALADDLFSLAEHIVQDGNVRSVLQGKDRHFHTGNADLFVDAGIPRQSRILNEALHFIDNSQHWLFFTCQYFPGGIVGKHLAQAQKRGVRVQVAFSPPSAHGYEQLGHYAYNALQRLQLPRNLFQYQLPGNLPVLHAKLLANEQGAILGSHNYTTQGVRLGTAEIALHVHNPAFSRQTVEFIGRMLPPGYAPLFTQ